MFTGVGAPERWGFYRKFRSEKKQFEYFYKETN